MTDTIFDAIATGDADHICRRANMIDTGESYVTAVMALRNMKAKAFVIIDGGITLDTHKTIMESYEGDEETAQKILDDEMLTWVVNGDDDHFNWLMNHLLQWYTGI